MANAEKFNASIAWLPDLIYTGHRFESDERGCDISGTIVRLHASKELRGTKTEFVCQIARCCREW